ncbi:phospholipid phosphatase-related protein type 2 isoform X2 [Ascaphus truei]|uniref:phospholipid phosphatase-related protein type 2 isoform X2 n=1 Tax=Ascaphus truei TaxID=8439 RepID=UPI003F59A37E
MYVTLVLRVKGSRLVKPSLCLALLGPSWLLSVLRVAEYRNHWSDVLAGTVTGAAIAVFLVTCVLNNFGSSGAQLRRPLRSRRETPSQHGPHPIHVKSQCEFRSYSPICTVTPLPASSP